MRCLSSETFLTLCAVDDDQREGVMMSWRLQMDDIMEFTKAAMKVKAKAIK